MVGSLQVPQGLRRALQRPPKQSPFLSNFRRDVIFVSLERRSGEFG